jgi:hypothetical protein
MGWTEGEIEYRIASTWIFAAHIITDISAPGGNFVAVIQDEIRPPHGAFLMVVVWNLFRPRYSFQFAIPRLVQA